MTMARVPKTKIIATLGPTSETATVIRKMVRSGLDVVRLNFSHGTHEEHERRLKIVRHLNEKDRRHIRVLQDLEGFRIRVGHFRGPKTRVFAKRQVVTLVREDAYEGAGQVPLDYHGDLSVVEPGQEIYIDDGNLELVAKSSDARHVKAVVVEGGVLRERKGVNMPGVALDFPALTVKDKADIEFGVRHAVDYVALSFVRSAADVQHAAAYIRARHPGCRIVAKIECREGIRNIDAIIEAADGIMIARGDMGIAVPVYQIPMIQKAIIRQCNRRKKFVITATQMLEHMTEHKRPTRAEVTDVANAILDGTDFVMLSGETAAGRYPVEAVRMMNDIIKYTETAP